MLCGDSSRWGRQAWTGVPADILPHSRLPWTHQQGSSSIFTLWLGGEVEWQGFHWWRDYHLVWWSFIHPSLINELSNGMILLIWAFLCLDTMAWRLLGNSITTEWDTDTWHNVRKFPPPHFSFLHYYHAPPKPILPTHITTCAADKDKHTSLVNLSQTQCHHCHCSGLSIPKSKRCI